MGLFFRKYVLVAISMSTNCQKLYSERRSNPVTDGKEVCCAKKPFKSHLTCGKFGKGYVNWPSTVYDPTPFTLSPSPHPPTHFSLSPFPLLPSPYPLHPTPFTLSPFPLPTSPYPPSPYPLHPIPLHPIPLHPPPPPTLISKHSEVPQLIINKNSR